MKILVTGASGCVGHSVVGELQENGHEVSQIARKATDAISQKGTRTFALDLSCPLDLTVLPREIDAVIHLAQSRRFREFPDAAGDVFAINTAATLDLARYAASVGAKSFVYASTGSVYVAGSDPVTEDAPTTPANFYAASKLAAEDLLAPFDRQMAVSIQRLFYVYGPKQKGMLTDGLAERIRRGDTITLQGEGGITIAPTFSVDIARIVRLACEQEWSGTINVGSPGFTNLRDYASMIGDTIGREAKFDTSPGPAPKTVLPNLDKLMSIAGMITFTPPAKGLKATFAE